MGCVRSESYREAALTTLDSYYLGETTSSYGYSIAAVYVTESIICYSSSATLMQCISSSTYNRVVVCPQWGQSINHVIAHRHLVVRTAHAVLPNPELRPKCRGWPIKGHCIPRCVCPDPCLPPPKTRHGRLRLRISSQGKKTSPACRLSPSISSRGRWCR